MIEDPVGDAMAAPDSAQSSITNHQSEIPRPTAFRAFWVLVAQSFQRHWRVRQMGWVAVGLLGITVVAVALVTASPAGWGIENRRVPRTRVTYREHAEQLLPDYRHFGHKYDDPTARPLPPAAVPNPLDPTGNALQSLILSVPHAVLSSPKFTRDWAFMNYSRWVILGAYVGFVLPLFTLAYGSGAFGTDRESRTLIWLMTRPIPRWAIYLAKFVGTLPWCVMFGVGGFVAVCLAGGEYGREALALYWPAALFATVAFAALFHLVGAVFRRPVVVGLIYVFFYEALVSALPGSLKLLSVTFYARSLMYNGAQVAGYPVEMLDVTQAVSPTSARWVLIGSAAALTALGMRLFDRSEYRDDV